MKNISRIAFACLAVCVFTTAAPAQDKARKLVKFQQKDEPIEIVKVTLDRREVSLNSAFESDDEWVKGLIFTVRNVSQQPIHYLSLEIGIPVTGTEADEIGVTLMKGISPDSPGDRTHEPINLRPGQTCELRFDGAQFATAKRFMGKLGGKIDARRVRVSVGMTVFTDNTAWSHGSTLLPDPYNRDDLCFIVNPGGVPTPLTPKRRRSLRTNNTSPTREF